MAAEPDDITANLEFPHSVIQLSEKALLKRQRVDTMRDTNDSRMVQSTNDSAFPQRVVEHDQLARLMSMALCRLKFARDERVLRLRFGFVAQCEKTLEEIGTDFSVTRERIRQIEAKALRRLTKSRYAREMRRFLVD
jgi:RNA polymerase sigma factor (sigma-70 family)